MPDDAAPATAALDPWLPVTEVDEAGGASRTYLFGFAVAHHRLGGMAWMTTSPVVSTSEVRATTESGTVYALGRRLSSPDEIGDREGEVAFRALVLRSADDGERSWLAACKIARHLGLATPLPYEASRFFEDHGGAYAARLLRTAPAGLA
jgi:hypothetical protein